MERDGQFAMRFFVQGALDVYGGGKDRVGFGEFAVAQIGEPQADLVSCKFVRPARQCTPCDVVGLPQEALRLRVAVQRKREPAFLQLQASHPDMTRTKCGHIDRPALAEQRLCTLGLSRGDIHGSQVAQHRAISCIRFTAFSHQLLRLAEQVECMIRLATQPIVSSECVEGDCTVRCSGRGPGSQDLVEQGHGFIHAAGCAIRDRVAAP